MFLKNTPSSGVMILINHSCFAFSCFEDFAIRVHQELPGECAILSWKLKRLPTPWFDDVGKNNIKPQEKGAEMGSLLRTAKKHKKSRRLGEPEVMAREEYGE